ncbi:ABC transporter permease [Solirubrobacter soli]|uniref:ABC transporter permease n=1 Tax=Solirubrobacter soli TaxID=363832 RepID=UPI00040E23E2|nr:ABC transporter permease [Solirubrobacter soli]
MIAAELLILRKRAATWILLAVWTLLGIFFAYVIPYALDPESDDITPFLPHALTGTLLEGFPFFGGVFALMLGVFALGSEYGWSTLKTLFTQGPSRTRVLVAKLAALGLTLVGFVLCQFLAGLIASLVIARVEGASAALPSAWLLARAVAAGWLMLAVWAALGVLLGVLTRGTSVAIGLGILYALLVEGVLSNIDALEPIAGVFLRANGYSLAKALGAGIDSIASSGPGAFGGPFVGAGQAVAVLAGASAMFLAIARTLLVRRDVG